jgi:hypothetical protein
MTFKDIPFLGSGVVALNPTLYTNLSAWWDADFLSYADATPIDNASAKWTDRSGNSNHLIQATSAKRPLLKTSIINGKKIVRFDGAGDPNNDELTLTSALTFTNTSFTIMVVGLVTADSILFGYSGSNQQFRRYRSNAENMSFYDGAQDVQSSTLATAHGSVHLMVWRRDSASSGAMTFRENGTNRTTGSPTSGATFVVDRMGVTSSVFSQLTGDVGEAIIYNAFRTDAEVDNLYTNYLKAKWGLP